MSSTFVLDEVKRLIKTSSFLRTATSFDHPDIKNDKDAILGNNVMIEIKNLIRSSADIHVNFITKLFEVYLADATAFQHDEMW